MYRWWRYDMSDQIKLIDRWNDESDDIASQFDDNDTEEVEKYNKNHGKDGRFSSGGGGSAASTPLQRTRTAMESHTSSSGYKLVNASAADNGRFTSGEYRFTIHDAHGNVLHTREGKSSRIEQLHKDYASQLKSGKHKHKDTQDAYDAAIRSGATHEQAFKMYIKSVSPAPKVEAAPPKVETPAPKPKAPKTNTPKVRTPQERIAEHHAAIDGFDLNTTIGRHDASLYMKKKGLATIYGMQLLDTANRAAVVKHIVSLQETYPLKAKLQHFNIKDFGKGQENVYAWHIERGIENHFIEMNSHHFSDKAAIDKSYANGVRQGFHPKGTDKNGGAEAVLTHEYGHAVQTDNNHKSHATNHEAMVARQLKDEVTSNAANKNIVNEVSKYASKNEHEYFAESFAQMHYLGKDTNKHTKLVAQIALI